MIIGYASHSKFLQCIKCNNLLCWFWVFCIPDLPAHSGSANPLPLKKIATLKPEELPTKKDLKDAIPAHCFEYSVVTSLSLVVRDGI